jgi:hypothetical protein
VRSGSGDEDASDKASKLRAIGDALGNHRRNGEEFKANEFESARERVGRYDRGHEL